MGRAIPIENLYYLFCYAWDQFPYGKTIKTGLSESPKILDLFAHILVRATHGLMRRGLDRGYLEFSDDIETVRGRIDLSGTIRRNLLAKGQVTCRFEELDRNVLHNQIIKATIQDLANSDGVDKGLVAQLRDIGRALNGISAIDLSSQLFRRVQITRDTAQYGLLLKVCELLHHMRLPTESGATSRFADILDDEVRMSKVFESFIRNFYRHEQNEFASVRSEKIFWELEAVEPQFADYLPSMITDVTLRSPQRTVVVDAKYYRQTLTNYRGERVWASHLYQLFSYLSNMERISEVDRSAEGIILYPVVGKPLDLRFEGRGHKISVRTINLDQDWRSIREQLLAVIRLQPAGGMLASPAQI